MPGRDQRDWRVGEGRETRVGEVVLSRPSQVGVGTERHRPWKPA